MYTTYGTSFWVQGSHQRPWWWQWRYSRPRGWWWWRGWGNRQRGAGKSLKPLGIQVDVAQVFLIHSIATTKYLTTTAVLVPSIGPCSIVLRAWIQRHCGLLIKLRYLFDSHLISAKPWSVMFWSVFAQSDILLSHQICSWAREFCADENLDY